MNTASAAVIHGRIWLRTFFHQLQHQRVAVAHPHHRRNAPEKAVQQVDAPAQIELELAVIPEHGTEQQLCNSAAHIF